MSRLAEKITTIIFSVEELAEIYYSLDYKRTRLIDGLYGEPGDPFIKEWIMIIERSMNKILDTGEV
jgi:hypothetical protein